MPSTTSPAACRARQRRFQLPAAVHPAERARCPGAPARTGRDPGLRRQRRQPGGGVARARPAGDPAGVLGGGRVARRLERGQPAAGTLAGRPTPSGTTSTRSPAGSPSSPTATASTTTLTTSRAGPRSGNSSQAGNCPPGTQLKTAPDCSTPARNFSKPSPSCPASTPGTSPRTAAVATRSKPSSPASSPQTKAERQPPQTRVIRTSTDPSEHGAKYRSVAGLT